MARSVKRLPLEETKRLLLQTGLEILVSENAKGDFTVKLRDVVDRANRTTGSAYQIWKSQTEYRRDLALYVAESVEYADPEPIGKLLGPELDQATTLEETIELVGRAYFNYFHRRPEFAVFLRLASLSDPEQEVAEAVLRGYRKLQETLGMFLEFAVVTRGNREYAAGVTIQQISSVVTALTEGFAIKARFSLHGDGSMAEKRVEEIRDDYVASLLALTQALTTPAC